MFPTRPHCCKALGLVLVITAAASILNAAAKDKTKTDVREYRVVHGWPELPENTVLPEVSGVAVDTQDNVFVLTRAGRKWPDSDVLDLTPIPAETVLLFDGRTGKQLAAWGKDVFAMPHHLTVDAGNNVWIADVAYHQVFKFSHGGKLLLTLGERSVPGEDGFHFNRPSDVAVTADGSVYVSDGYGNSRVVKFSPEGRFLLAWGSKGNNPGQFDTPHAIELDLAGRVFVLDRANKRVQVFDSSGKFLSQWPGPPFVSPQDVAIAADGTAFVTDDGEDRLPDRAGVWVLHPDGSLAGHFGKFGNYDGQFLDAHAIAVSKAGEIYVADFTGKRVQKFVPAKR
jgi:peptidylamidoglycolate lyase